jgi:TrmH family RNA methyltransferase
MEPMTRPGIRTISANNGTYQVLQSLKTNRKKRNELNEILIEGIGPIKQAVASRRVRLKKVLFADYGALSDWGRNFVDSAGFPEALQLEKGLYDGLSDKNEPSELMITAEYRKMELADLALGAAPFIVIFDRPGDPGNLGSLIRSANSFGADAFVTLGHGVDVFEPKVIRSSLGAVFHTQVAHAGSFEDLETWLASLRKRCGLKVVGTDSTGDVPAQDGALARPVALMLGNEAKGLSVRLKGLADRIVRIPLEGAVNSLNVACAGSILMWLVRAHSGAPSALPKGQDLTAGE